MDIFMKKSKTDLVRKKIIKRTANLDIAGFLKEEVYELFKHLHFYKLNNILKNIDSLTEYLLFLDKKNTEQLIKLTWNTKNKISDQKEISYEYYLSKKWFETLWSEKTDLLLNSTNHISTELQSSILWMKWLLLLTANEFCHASMTRMSINREIWQKQNS